MEKNSGAKSALAVLVAINILNFYDRNAIGALTEPIRKEFHLSDTEVGLLGSVFTWLYAVVGVPIGNFADRKSRKTILAAGIVVWSALTGTAALASSYAILLFSRLGFAVGEAAVAPTAASWIGDLFPAAKRAAPLALFMIGVPLGGALAYFFSGPIAQAFGWRSAMVVAAAPALLLIPLLLRLKEPRRGAAEAGHEHSEMGFQAIKAVAKIPTMWWIIASGALLNFNMYALGTFMPAFLSRIHHVTLAQSGIDTGITYAIGGIGGTLIAMWMGDRIIRTRRNGRLLWAAGITALAAPTAYFSILSTDLVAAIAFMTLSYGALCTYYGLVYSSIQDIVAPAMRAMSIYFMAMYLCGAGFGPLLTGRVSDLMARRAADAAGSAVLTDAFKAVGLQQAMLMMPLFSVLLGLVLYAGSRTILGDMKKRAMASGLAAVA
ncbi:MAG TPA: MFS transporter [Bryobacteraceae bacterium]|nr:MFS transporter [Bryobacteraceae bacterium]